MRLSWVHGKGVRWKKSRDIGLGVGTVHTSRAGPRRLGRLIPEDVGNTVASFDCCLLWSSALFCWTETKSESKSLQGDDSFKSTNGLFD